jgi:hypothetical protein
MLARQTLASALGWVTGSTCIKLNVPLFLVTKMVTILRDGDGLLSSDSSKKASKTANGTCNAGTCCGVLAINWKMNKAGLFSSARLPEMRVFSIEPHDLAPNPGPFDLIQLFNLARNS